MPTTRALFLYFLLLLKCLLLLCIATNAQAGQPADTWASIEGNLFPGKSIQDGAAFMAIHLGKTAENPAIVPIGLTINRPDVSRAWLLVDGNPLPLVATFNFLQVLPEVHTDLRIRLEKNTFVRLVAETTNGDFYMHKVSIATPGGGCGGGMDGDEAKLRAEAGRMKFHLNQTASANQPGAFTLLIKHPMRTGFERTTQGYYAKSWYLRQISFSQNGKPFLDLELGVGSSADPTLKLPHLLTLQSPIEVLAVDNEGKTFRQQFDLAQFE